MLCRCDIHFSFIYFPVKICNAKQMPSTLSTISCEWMASKQIQQKKKTFDHLCQLTSTHILINNGMLTLIINNITKSNRNAANRNNHNNKKANVINVKAFISSAINLGKSFSCSALQSTLFFH